MQKEGKHSRNTGISMESFLENDSASAILSSSMFLTIDCFGISKEIFFFLLLS